MKTKDKRYINRTCVQVFFDDDIAADMIETVGTDTLCAAVKVLALYGMKFAKERGVFAYRKSIKKEVSE